MPRIKKRRDAPNHGLTIEESEEIGNITGMSVGTSRRDVKEDAGLINEHLLIPAVDIQEDSEEYHLQVKEEHEDIDDDETLKDVSEDGAESQQLFLDVEHFMVTQSNYVNDNDVDAELPVDESEESDEKQLYRCKKCDKSYTSNRGLQRHVKDYHMRNDQKPFSCKLCNTGFSQKGNLRQHMKIHSGEKPFQCEVCQKNFTRKFDLLKHERRHTGAKPYSCLTCFRSFSDNKSLTNHERTHTGDKPFTCSVCTKSFSQRGTLDRHMRLHTGEKPFSCDVCKKPFSDKGNLNQHMKVHKK